LNKYLNAKEYDILSTILHSDEPLNVSQIIEHNPGMKSNIVQPSIRKLMKLNLVEVADITLKGNVFSRRFKTTAAAPDIIQNMFIDDYMHFNKLVSGQTLINAMMQADNNPDKAIRDINELEKLLSEYKKKKNTKKE